MSDDNAFRVQQSLQKMMQAHVGIVRTEKDMQEALPLLQELKVRADKVHVEGNREYNPGWHTAMDLTNLLTVSEAITRSAIERKESRGGHFREDFPNKDKALGEINLITRRSSSGEMQVIRQPIPPMPDELTQIIKEQQQ